jgi:uncharacterized integral membrane protein (TIGR00697 family)
MDTNKKLNKSTVLAIILATYSVFTVLQNLYEMKTLGTESFAFGGGGVVFSWATFLIMDICTEIFGKKTTIKVYTFAGILNLFTVLVSQVLVILPGVYPEQNEAFRLIFSNGPRTAIASFVAFWFGNFVNMAIMLWLRKIDKSNSRFAGFVMLFLRAVLSTIFGQFVDNALFATLAFAPIGLSAFEMRWIDIFTSSVVGVFNETVIETCMVPFMTIPVINKLKKSLN